jgi:geranylgeranyl diphosphate synthase type II
MEFAEPTDKIQLTQLFSIQPTETADKVETVKQLFERTGASKATQDAIEMYTQKALQLVEELPVDQAKKELLIGFAQNLMHRTV